MTDDFKYKNFDHYPNMTGEIKPSKKGNLYSIKFDTAPDVSYSLYHFSKAFYNAADTIVTRMLNKRQIDELDQYFFPVFFLYRHSIELFLKSIACTQITNRTDCSIFFKNTFHDPESILKYIIDNTTLSLPDAELQWLLEFFHNLANFDKASDSFRYPYHIKKGNDLLGNQTYTFARVFEKQTHIDLIAEANKMIAAYEILENWYDSIINNKTFTAAKEYAQCSSTFLDEGGSYYEQSVVGYEFHHNDFLAHCSGYLECANYLKQCMIEEYSTRNFMPHLFYPMCYLYRNDVELLLKAIIFEFSGMPLPKKCEALYENKHKISKLFSFIEDEVMPGYSLSKAEDFIVKARRYCDQLHDFDTDSSKFRYPIDKNCLPYQNNIRYYDFVQVGVFLESLCNALDAIHGEIERRAEYLAEMEAEYTCY